MRRVGEESTSGTGEGEKTTKAHVKGHVQAKSAQIIFVYLCLVDDGLHSHAFKHL